MRAHTQVAAAFVESAPLLTAYAYGDLTGVVVDIGASSTQILPIYDGVVLEHASKRVNYLGGNCVDAFVLNAINGGKESAGNKDFFSTLVARDLKERIALASLQPVTGGALGLLEAYELLDGRRVSLDGQLGNLCGELIFSPEVVSDDLELRGLHHHIAEVVEASPM